MGFKQDLENWWNSLREEAKPAAEEFKKAFDIEVNAIKADVTTGLTKAEADVLAAFETHAPEIRAKVEAAIAKIEAAVIEALSKH